MKRFQICCIVILFLFVLTSCVKQNVLQKENQTKVNTIYELNTDCFLMQEANEKNEKIENLYRGRKIKILEKYDKIWDYVKVVSSEQKGYVKDIYVGINQNIDYEILEFGRTKNNKSIQWYKIKEEDNKVLLVSKEILGQEIFSKNYFSSWRDSYLRYYLNTKVYEELFNEKEKKRICLKENITNNHEGFLFIEIPTLDKLFIMTDYEYSKYGIKQERNIWHRNCGIHFDANNQHYLQSPQSYQIAIWVNFLEDKNNEKEFEKQIEHGYFRDIIDNDFKYFDSCDLSLKEKKQGYSFENAKYQFGEIINFGHFEQDGNIDTRDDIEWIIIGKVKNKYLLISKNILMKTIMQLPYEIKFWNNTYMREILNYYFYKNAFTKEEQEKIQTTENRTLRWDTNDEFERLSSKKEIDINKIKIVENYKDTTIDKIFLLGLDDIMNRQNNIPSIFLEEKIFNNNLSDVMNNYAIKGFSIRDIAYDPSFQKGNYEYDGIYDRKFSAIDNENIIYIVNNKNKEIFGVRPCLWLKEEDIDKIYE